VFVVLTQGESFTSDGVMRKFPRIQLVEGHLCRTPPEFDKDPMVIDGVRVDSRGRPVGYYFAEEKKVGEFVFGSMRQADDVIHVFEPSRPGQVRGMSFFHSVINELHDLDDLHILEMQAARENASTAIWIKTQTGELNAASLRRSAFTESTETNTGGNATESRQSYYNDVSGGRARVLKAGDEVMQNPGQRPSVTTVEYWRLKRELVCAGVEIPYCLVFPDSMQGTVYRGALDMATAFFRSRHGVIADVQRRIWSYVMRFGIAMERGLASPPGDWRKVSVLPPRAPNVDVGRNATAEKDALLDGRTNYDLIYGPLGLSWNDELLKLNGQLEFIEKKCPALARHLMSQKPQQPEPESVPIAGTEDQEDA
jgi:capsid protein